MICYIQQIKIKGDVVVTEQKKRYYVSDFSISEYNIAKMLIHLIKKSNQHRISNLPDALTPQSKSYALYSYGEVILFEMALKIHGDTLRTFSEKHHLSYRHVLRIVNHFNRGRITSDMGRMHKGDAYTMKVMMNYTYETIPLLESLYT